MNFIFLGNGNITSNNFNACYLLNGKILIDAPAGVNKIINDTPHNIRDVDYIFITHLHGDHYFDIPFILFDNFASNRERPLVFIGPKKLKNKVKKLLKLAFPHSYLKIWYRLDLVFLDAGKLMSFEIADLTINSVMIKHGNLRNCYGYIFDNGKKKVGITGDTELCPGVNYMARNVNALIIDVSSKGNNHHLKFDDFKELTKEFKKTTFLPTHYPDRIKPNLKNIKNVNIIDCGEQFFI